MSLKHRAVRGVIYGAFLSVGALATLTVAMFVVCFMVLSWGPLWSMAENAGVLLRMGLAVFAIVFLLSLVCEDD